MFSLDIKVTFGGSNVWKKNNKRMAFNSQKLSLY